MPDHRPPLLPYDRHLAEILGIPEDDYRAFKSELRQKSRIDLSVPQAGLIEIIVITALVISTGLQIAASFFKPREQQGAKGGIDSKTRDANNITENAKFSPRVGFNSVQQPASLGTTIPLIYAKRQSLPAQQAGGATTDPWGAIPPRPAGTYGGVRINMPLLWSQLVSVNGNQFLKAIFMLGEGTIGALDPKGFAIGDNSLSAYRFEDETSNEEVGRMTIYFSPSGGRIQSGDRLTGRLPANDTTGNTELEGAVDVYQIRSTGNQFKPDFCYASRPSNSTKFGLFSHIPNNMGYRVNPRIRPTVTLRIVPTGKSGDYMKALCDDDPQALADLWKYKYIWSGRAGILSTSGGNNLNPGDTFVYKLERESEANTKIKFDNSNTDIDSNDSGGEARCSDIGSAVASRQRAADDALIAGELYKAGSCLCILVNRDYTAPAPEAPTYNQWTKNGIYGYLTTNSNGEILEAQLAQASGNIIETIVTNVKTLASGYNGLTVTFTLAYPVSYPNGGVIGFGILDYDTTSTSYTGDGRSFASIGKYNSASNPHFISLNPWGLDAYQTATQGIYIKKAGEIITTWEGGSNFTQDTIVGTHTWKITYNGLDRTNMTVRVYKDDVLKLTTTGVVLPENGRFIFGGATDSSYGVAGPVILSALSFTS
jgi:hypothetical protein